MKIIDDKRNKTEARKFYRKTSKNIRNQKKILESLPIDTGFDVICSSCLQYKSKEYGKPVKLLSKEKKRENSL